MELRYPILFIFLILITLCFMLIKSNKKNVFITGSKIINTNYIKDTNYYKSRIHIYNRIKLIINILYVSAIVSSICLVSRIAKIDVINDEQYNRDIYLCLDVSSSIDELNGELVTNLKDVVNSLKGERFGVSIFNTTSVTLVPLTDDYEYISDVLDKIKKSIDLNNSSSYDYNDDNYLYDSNYIVSGTLEGASIRGGSLIGDGLATCAYGFSDLEEDRTRIIILSTDNDLGGTPLLTLNQAADITKRKNIKIYGIGTSNISEQNRLDFKNAISKTNGKYYEQNKSSIKDIVNDIESTSKSLLKKQSKTKIIDIPELPFGILIFSVTFIIVLKNKI